MKSQLQEVLECEYDPRDRPRDQAQGDAVKLRPGMVWLDGGPAFRCWLGDDRWNGFACPFFDRETAERVCREVTTGEMAIEAGILGVWGKEELDGKLHFFTATEPSEAEEMETWEPALREVEGVEGEVELWSVGGWAWCWTEVPEGSTANYANERGCWPVEGA